MKVATIEWKTGEEGWDRPADEWELPEPEEMLESPEAKEVVPRSKWRRRFTILVTLTAALIAVVSLALRWRANRNLAAVKAEVQGVLDQETWALESANRGLYTSLLDQHAPAVWLQHRQEDFERQVRPGSFAVEVTELVLIQPDLALAEVQIDSPDGSAYRETRAYRQAGN